MSVASRWDDLKPRILTAVVLIAVGFEVIWLGGTTFAITVAVVTGIMVWELSRMIAFERVSEAIILGIVTAASLLLARQLPDILILPMLLVPAVVGFVLLRAHPMIFVAYAIGITSAGYGLTMFSDVYGIGWLMWLVIVVVVTDIAGYFAGRVFGGPKFWPSISPKKTWSGIVAGWLGAVIVSFVFLSLTDAGRALIWISVVLSFASQMGDIAESAVKRKMGVKDSSNLLPGHGGLFDRFDGLLGASLVMLLTALVVDVPELQF